MFRWWLRASRNIAKHKVIATFVFLILSALYVGRFAVDLWRAGDLLWTRDILMPFFQFCGSFVLGLIVKVILASIRRSRLSDDLKILLLAFPHLELAVFFVAGAVSIVLVNDVGNIPDIRSLIGGFFPAVLSAPGIFLLGNDATAEFQSSKAKGS